MSSEGLRLLKHANLEVAQLATVGIVAAQARQFDRSREARWPAPDEQDVERDCVVRRCLFQNQPIDGEPRLMD
jgi:hypothetical protein